ncbi:MAG TPA: AI-2E family transporter [Gemmataceae bacterium]|nr:AI-2E family transporter [Gemmataceae bacterium]
MINLNMSVATRWGLNALLLLSATVALYLGKWIFIPTILALLLAAMLWPVVDWLHRGVPVLWPRRRAGFPWLLPSARRLPLPWTVACTGAVGALVVLTLALTIGFGLLVGKLVQDLPRDPERQRAVYRELREKVQRASPGPLPEDYFPEDPEKSVIYQALAQALGQQKTTVDLSEKTGQPLTIDIHTGSNKSGLTEALKEVVDYLRSWLWMFILVMFQLLFLLLEGPMLSRKVVEIFGPSQQMRAKAVAALRDMANQVRTYLVWRTIVNFGLGLIVGIFYYEMGLKQPWVWAMLTAVLCYIPYIGPIAAGIPPVVDAFVTCPSPWYAVAVLGFYLVVINVEGYLIVPVVMGRPMQLNATTVLLACLFWDLVWGTPGLFLAMPLMAALKAVCTHVPGLEAWANLMSTREYAAEREAEPSLEDAHIMSVEDQKALASSHGPSLED